MASAWESCLFNLTTNALKGAAIGIIFNVVIAAKRKAWLPVYFGGLASGYSYVVCDQSFKQLDVAK